MMFYLQKFESKGFQCDIYNRTKYVNFWSMFKIHTVLLAKCSTWQARRTSLPRTPVTLGESSGFMKGPPLKGSSSLISSIAKAAERKIQPY